MKLILIGHDYKYAAEQIMLMMFPGERPEYTDLPADNDFYAKIRVSRDEKNFARAETIIHRAGFFCKAVSCSDHAVLSDKRETDRIMQKIIKQSFYKAALNLVETPPPWGAMTGIRPAKIFAAMLESGLTPDFAVQKFCNEYYVLPERVGLCAAAAMRSLEVKASLAPRDIALYIGIPFCPTRCAYCSFVSNSVEKSLKLVEPFLESLTREIDTVSHIVKKLCLNIKSVYIGGGTPTTLTAPQLDALLYKIADSFDLSKSREYTVEAGRPDTITPDKLAVIAKYANRVSINPQTMSQEVLRLIGRKHTPEDFLRACALVRECGGLSVNTDLIAGLPGDTVSGFCRTLDTVLAQTSANITVHTLSLKKGSRIMLEHTPIPEGSAVLQMLDYASQKLRGAGYRPYYLYRQKYTSGGFENVGWSLPGSEGLYNICMMEELCTVIALGGGGVTKLVSGNGRIERVFNVKYPAEYIDRPESAALKVRRIEEFYDDKDDL